LGLIDTMADGRRTLFMKPSLDVQIKERSLTWDACYSYLTVPSFYRRHFLL